MSESAFPTGFRFERLRREHPRKSLRCRQEKVDDWLAAKALQQQEKHLSVTNVLLDEAEAIAGYYTLAIGQMNFNDLPAEVTRRLPHRMLPVAVLAWLGVSQDRQGQGLGRLLMARALRDCYEAGKTFAILAVVLDCIDDDAKSFYQRWSFEEMPERSYRLFLSAERLEAMMQEK
ncbi:MAG TPA: GNAT family N-acetyltransferase [Gemmataceae bacterium]|nr:GNAT family N-acetyltransferase [Gemmataceae bacterium]